MQYRQLGGLGVLRGVIHGFSEEARTRGFPSPSFDGFGFTIYIVRIDALSGSARSRLTRILLALCNPSYYSLLAKKALCTAAWLTIDIAHR
jgi:hypothetical protein